MTNQDQNQSTGYRFDETKISEISSKFHPTGEAGDRVEPEPAPMPRVTLQPVPRSIVPSVGSTITTILVIGLVLFSIGWCAVQPDEPQSEIEKGAEILCATASGGCN